MKLEYNVCRFEPNSKEFITYDVIPYLKEQYDESRDKPVTYDEFKQFVEKESRYQYWSRCQYEIILSDWPGESIKRKVDVHQQIMMNLDIVTNVLMEKIREDENS